MVDNATIDGLILGVWHITFSTLRFQWQPVLLVEEHLVKGENQRLLAGKWQKCQFRLGSKTSCHNSWTKEFKMETILPISHKHQVKSYLQNCRICLFTNLWSVLHFVYTTFEI